MGIIAWIILGALAGWLASLLMNTDHEQGGLGNIVVGIVGAVIGGFAVQLFGVEGITGFNVWSLLVALLGSVILLGIVKAIRGTDTSQRERIERI